MNRKSSTMPPHGWTQAEYRLEILRDLDAHLEDGFRPAERIAAALARRSRAASVTYVAKVCQQMASEGWIKGRRGRGQGYRVAWGALDRPVANLSPGGLPCPLGLGACMGRARCGLGAECDRFCLAAIAMPVWRILERSR